MKLDVHTLSILKDNFVYVLVNSVTREGAVVDPGDAEPVLRFLSAGAIQLTDILCTHHHLDHVGGVGELKKRFLTARVWTSARDQERIAESNTTAREGERFLLLGQEVTVLEVPGHTAGQIAFYFPNEKMVFTGDTLFSLGCGRLFEGTPAEMFASLQKFKALPRDTHVYFGHEYTLRNLEFVLSRMKGDVSAWLEYRRACEDRLAAGQPTTPTTLATELKLNPFLFAHTVEEFREWREARNHW